MASRTEYKYRSDIHARIIQAAIEGRLLTYSELKTTRRMVGSYLFRITHEEDQAGRPPITALVVRKQTGRPGPGFLQAMDEIGYAKPGESELAVRGQSQKFYEDALALFVSERFGVEYGLRRAAS